MFRRWENTFPVFAQDAERFAFMDGVFTATPCRASVGTGGRSDTPNRPVIFGARNRVKLDGQTGGWLFKYGQPLQGWPLPEPPAEDHYLRAVHLLTYSSDVYIIKQ